MKVSLYLLFAFVLALRAEDLLPELQPAATKYRADIAALDAQKATSMNRSREKYSTALAAAEKVATLDGKLSVVTAITKERASLMSGEILSAAPPEFPRTLLPTRKSYNDEAKQIGVDFIARKKNVDGDYLRALGNLQSRVGKRPELALQIANEKAKLLESVPGENALRSALTGNTWTWEAHNGTSKMNFSPGGKFKHSAFEGTWKITGTRTVAIQFSGGKTTLQFNENLTAFDCRDLDSSGAQVHGQIKK